MSFSELKNIDKIRKFTQIEKVSDLEKILKAGETLPFLFSPSLKYCMKYGMIAGIPTKRQDWSKSVIKNSVGHYYTSVKGYCAYQVRLLTALQINLLKNNTMVKFIVVKVESATDETIETIVKTDNEDQASRTAELLNDGIGDEKYFYCVDEIWE